VLCGVSEKSGRRVGVLVVQVIVGCAVLAMVGGIVALVWLFITGIPDQRAQAQVGDCLVGAAEGRFEVVDCADGSAAFTVVGRAEGRAQTEAAEACKTLASPAPERAYWEGKAGEPGVVLCLRTKPLPQ
jgi:hypothetical protein